MSLYTRVPVLAEVFASLMSLKLINILSLFDSKYSYGAAFFLVLYVYTLIFVPHVNLVIDSLILRSGVQYAVSMYC